MSEHKAQLSAQVHRNAIAIFDKKTKLKAKLLTISEIGAGILLPKQIAEGTEFLLLINLPAGKGTYECLIKVRAVHYRLQQDVYYIGVHFVGLKDHERARIKQYILGKHRL
ncbi:MAG: PilZ domain-containing protein [Gammaproteobacteria bacterium]|nr:PilZ domain-containing protein [Gammaproteobacteria bacterium]